MTIKKVVYDNYKETPKVRVSEINNSNDSMVVAVASLHGVKRVYLLTEQSCIEGHKSYFWRTINRPGPVGKVAKTIKEAIDYADEDHYRVYVVDTIEELAKIILEEH